eukprot:SM000020S06107  [mRNA]  locus=s20:1036852:1039451:- [translate_table: standard]
MPNRLKSLLFLLKNGSSCSKPRLLIDGGRDILYNNFQGAFRLDFFASTQNLTWVDISRNYFIGAAPNATKEGRAVVHANFNCLDRPAKYQRPASVCAGLPAPTCSPDSYKFTCRNWQPDLLDSTPARSRYPLVCCLQVVGHASMTICLAPRTHKLAAGLIFILNRNGSCVVMSLHSAGSPCSLHIDNYNHCEPNGACDGAGHCRYDYAANARKPCDYVPEDDSAANGTCAQVSPLPDGTDCARALLNDGPLTEYKGCATASCMSGKCMLKFLPNGTSCDITDIKGPIHPDCVNGKCSEGICQIDSYKLVDTLCDGSCHLGCCSVCNNQGSCVSGNGPCYFQDYSGQCEGSVCNLYGYP